jgi:hypothetical protein
MCGPILGFISRYLRYESDNGGQCTSAELKKMRARDVFVFFAAGHGKTIDGASNANTSRVDMNRLANELGDKTLGYFCLPLPAPVSHPMSTPIGRMLVVLCSPCWRAAVRPSKPLLLTF